MTLELPEIPLERSEAGVSIEALARKRRAERGLADFLYFCNYFCRFPDINREEHGEIIGVIEKVDKIIAGRVKRWKAGTPRPEDALKLTIHVQAPRGALKTSIWMAFEAWLIIKYPWVAIRFNLNKVENAEKKVARVASLLRRGRIPQHYGELYSAGLWSRRAFKVKAAPDSEDATVQAGGPDEKQTSTHCDVLLNSDVQDETNSASAELRENMLAWRSDQQHLFRQHSPIRLEVWDTTVRHKHDIASQLVALSRREPKPRFLWVVKRPVADLDEWLQDSAHAKLNFPRLFPRQKVLQLFNAAESGLRLHDVYTQYFLDVSRAEHTKFRPEWLRPARAYDPTASKDSAERTPICLLPKRLNLSVTIDPADPDEIRKARERGDTTVLAKRCNTGMILWGMDEQKSRYELEAVSKQMSIPEMGDQIVSWFRMYHLPDRRKAEAGLPLFGENDRAARTWIFTRIGVEKAVFSAAAIIPPLRSYLASQPAMGEEWAKRLLNDRSGIQISTHKSKAARQDGTEVDWASGKVRAAQHQTDINPSAIHPLQVLLDAKKEYPVVSSWDILDAESLGWGPGFMFGPHTAQTETEAHRRAKTELEEMRALAFPKPGAIDAYYRKQMLNKRQPTALHGPSEFVGAEF